MSANEENPASSTDSTKKLKRNEPPPKQIGIAGGPGRVVDGGLFLKPSRNAESLFYEVVHQADHPASQTVFGALRWLAPFVCKYFGEKPAAEVPTALTTSSEASPGRQGDVRYLILENIFSPFKDAAVLDLKMQLSDNVFDYKRTGAANLLGCYVHGCEARHIAFKNRFNEFRGCNKPIDHFYSTLHRFLSRCTASESEKREILAMLRDASVVFSRLSSLGFSFPSCSLLFVYEQEGQRRPVLSFIDFEHAKYQDRHLNEWLDNMAALPRYDDVAAPLLAAPVPYSSAPMAQSSRLVRHAFCHGFFPAEYAVTIYLVRHAERHDYTDFNWAPTSPHPHDAPLSEAGERQSQDFADRLCHAKIHRLTSAPMQRAILGAETIARATRSLICVEPGFCEFLCEKSRTKVPSFFSRDVSISPWIDLEYQAKWPEIKLEAWTDVFKRSTHAVNKLIEDCRAAKGDLVVLSHRSTLQTVFAALLPDFEQDTKMEYGGIAMIAETEPGSNKFEMITFNELNHLRDRIQSPSSNPFRHIEGYYEDLSWSSYKSTAQMWAEEERKEEKSTDASTDSSTQSQSA